ncbi:MAG TPA: phosphotransferase family protein, partial [Rhizomicrobium sp.]|nr:phosphotransferase family protein [Rhizomicrobium sp.]
MPDFLPALERALGKALPGFERAENVTRLSGGASQETWSLDAVGDGGAVPLILRRAPGGVWREGSASVPLTTEAIVIEAARASGVAAPTVRYVLTPEDGVGEGYVMDRLSGETIARKILRDEAFAGVRPKLARECGEILARIHAVDITPLADILPVIDGPALLKRYRDLYDAYDYPHPVFELAFQWLDARLKPLAQPKLVHGDFRNGNLLISPARLEAALDWELTHIGDPLEDIGWVCTNSWRFGQSEKIVGGFGDLDDLLAAYAQGGGARYSDDDVRTW